MSKKFGLQALLFLLSIGLFVGVHAQSSTAGNITGTVRDPQGAAVANTEITIVEEKTGALAPQTPTMMDSIPLPVCRRAFTPSALPRPVSRKQSRAVLSCTSAKT